MGFCPLPTCSAPLRFWPGNQEQVLVGAGDPRWPRDISDLSPVSEIGTMTHAVSGGGGGALRHSQGSAIPVQGISANLVITIPTQCLPASPLPTDHAHVPSSCQELSQHPFTLSVMPFAQTNSVLLTLGSMTPPLHAPVTSQCLLYSPNVFPVPPSTSKYPLGVSCCYPVSSLSAQYFYISTQASQLPPRKRRVPYFQFRLGAP